VDCCEGHGVQWRLQFFTPRFNPDDECRTMINASGAFHENYAFLTISRIGHSRGARPVAQGFGSARLNHTPLCVGQIGLVSGKDGYAPGEWSVSTWRIQRWFRKPLGSSRAP
jgi:hypothetical protein